MEPGLRCPLELVSGEILLRHPAVGDSIGLFLRLFAFRSSEDMGIVALIGPCLTGDVVFLTR